MWYAFLEAARMAATSIRDHRLRSGLTLLGMVVGVFAIIVSVTAVKVIDVYFKDRLQFLGASTFQVSRYPLINMGDSRESRNRPPLTYRQIQRLERSLQTPAAVSPLEDFYFGKITYADRETEPNMVLMGTNEHFTLNFSHEIEVGRSFTQEDVLYGRSVTVIGADLQEVLFPTENPVGKTIRMGGQRYQVIGVLKAKGNFLGMSQDNRAYIPITKAFATYGIPNRNIATISVRVSSATQMTAAMSEVTGLMRVIRGDEPGDPNSFEVGTNDTMQQIFDAFTGTLTMGGALIGLIALLASGVGIMNIMLVSVTERTREIGIRKSLGARSADIMTQFLTEAFMLCQIGGILGILFGALTGNAVALYFEISAAFPTDWAIAAVILVTIIALVFGGYPALKAARLHPIQALRFE